MFRGLGLLLIVLGCLISLFVWWLLMEMEVRWALYPILLLDTWRARRARARHARHLHLLIRPNDRVTAPSLHAVRSWSVEDPRTDPRGAREHATRPRQHRPIYDPERGIGVTHAR